MKKELGIYIHIPFCIKKCAYCDFISFPNKLDIQQEYVNKILSEIEKSKNILENYDVSTIYIGGGTPSAINSELIKKIMKKINEYIEISKLQEITIEVNPGTVTYEKLQDYKEAGINRLSIGLQSTDDRLLNLIGRIHTYKEFLKTYEIARKVGFTNINVDLMIGLPNQTIKDIKNSIEKITNLDPKPEHISVYSLIIEPNTPIEEMLNDKKIKFPTDEEERNQYWYVKNKLEEKGYNHYEISNFSIPRKEAIHNTNCWKQKEYIGFGVAAHSFINKKRFSNTENLQEYLQKTSDEIKTINEIQNKLEQEKEYMLLGLRKIDGININEFKEKFTENPIYLFRKEIQKLVTEGLLEVDLNQIKLTFKGLDLANIVWEEFV